MRRVLAILIGILPCVVACTSSDTETAQEQPIGPSPTAHPSIQDATRKIIGAYCGKLSSCFRADFDLSFPAGVDQCIQQSMDKIREPTLPDQCTELQVEDCTYDTSYGDCPPSATGRTLPPSCHDC